MHASRPWHVPGKWYTSPHDFEARVLEQMPNLPKRVYIRDDTLREGEETPGVIFTLEDRLEIALKLQEAGIAEIEMPMGSSLDESRKTVKAFKEAGVNCPKSAIGAIRWAPYADKRWMDQLRQVSDLGVDGATVALAFAREDLWSDFAGEFSKEQICELIMETVRYAKSQGIRVGYGWPNVTRTYLETAKMFCKAAVEGAADRIQLYDSFGIGTPAGVRFLISEIKRVVGGTPVLFHCHNDFGMATANTLAAVEGGAEWCDVVVNGLGDRGGNAALEEVVAALEILRQVDTGMKMGKLFELSKLVERVSGVRCQPNKAVVGANAFLEESAAHLVGSLEAAGQGYPEDHVPYVPELVGQVHRLVIGSTTLFGGAIEYKLKEWGYDCSQESVERVRQAAAKKIAEKRYLTEDEFHAVCQGVLSS